MTKKKVVEKLKTFSIHDITGEPSNLMKLFTSIEAEFKNYSNLCIITESSYGDDGPILILYGERLETDIEYNKRLKQEAKAKKMQEKFKKHKEELEFKKYLELKAKFENEP